MALGNNPPNGDSYSSKEEDPKHGGQKQSRETESGKEIRKGCIPRSKRKGVLGYWGRVRTYGEKSLPQEVS